MNLETLGKGLQMAVDQAFVVNQHETDRLEAQAGELTAHEAHEQLQAINAGRCAGLRLAVAEAYASGKQEIIEEARNLAHQQAVSGFSRTLLRQLVRGSQKNRFDKQKDSTIREMNRRTSR